MSYSALDTNLLNRTGGCVVEPNGREWEPESVWSVWHGIWSEMFRTQAIKAFPRTTATVVICFAVDALPVAQLIVAGTTNKMLSAIENVFGNSASHIARMLRVSRPMVYHYREGMEPSLENKRRIETLAALAEELGGLVSCPLGGLLEVKQPEGRTLLEYLSDEDLDIPILRRVLERNINTADQALRSNLAISLTRGETSETRSDILRDRRSAGRPVYVGDPDAPGKLIQILPDGRRIRGRMVKRQFVPDEE